MALAYSAVSITALSSITTTEQFTDTADGWQSLLPNHIVSIAVAMGAHSTETITVTLYGSNDAGTTKFTIKQFTIAAADTGQKLIGSIMGAPHWSVGVVSSGSSETPTATFKVKDGPVNGA